MDEIATKRVIDAFEQALKKAGAQGFDDAAATIQSLADFLSDSIKPLLDRKNLENMLRAAEMNADDELMFTAAMESLPSLVVAALQMISSEAAKSFPISSAGRPKALTIETRKGVCEHVAKLHGQGTSLRTAKERAAQKFGISVSTVERTWAGRKKGHKPSLHELIGLFKGRNGN